MTPSQHQAATKLEEALKACASAKLGVYIYDSSVMVCPTDVNDPRWQDSPMEVCDDIGRTLHIPRLVCDGGAGC